MKTRQSDSRRISSPRILLGTLIFAISAQGCAHQGSAPAGAAALETTKTAEQPAAKLEAPAPAPPPILEQQALDRLKQMSEKLAAAKAFTCRSRSAVEVPSKTGQFLTFFAHSQVALERPNKLRAIVTGDVPNFHFYYDGSNVSAFDPEKNVYALSSAPGTIDKMLPFVMDKAGIHFPTDDLLYSDPYAVMTKGLTHAIVVGPTTVDGVRCQHFAFRAPGINWEIWIDSEKSGLPKRFAATYTEVDNFPRFLVEFSDWNLEPKLGKEEFVFKKPAKAKQVELAGRLEQKTE
jgi:hypothetical protein